MSERFDEFIKEINEKGGNRQSSGALTQYFQSADSFFNASKNYNYNDYSSFQQTSPIKDQLDGLSGARFNAWIELINNRETIGEDNFNKLNDQLNTYSTAINDFRTNYQKASDYYSKQANLQEAENKYLKSVQYKRNPVISDYRPLTEYVLQNPSKLSADQVVSSAAQNGWYEALTTSLAPNAVHDQKVDDNWTEQLKQSVWKLQLESAAAEKNGGTLPKGFDVSSLNGKSSSELADMYQMLYGTKPSLLDMRLGEYAKKNKLWGYNTNDVGKSIGGVVSAVPAGLESFQKGTTEGIEGLSEIIRNAAGYDAKIGKISINSGVNDDLKTALTDEQIQQRQLKNMGQYKYLTEYQNIYKPNVEHLPAANLLSDLTFTYANMAPSMMVNYLAPGAGTALLGLSAGGNSYGDALLEGKTKSEALAYGVASGSLEAITQKLLGGIGGFGKTTASKIASKIPANVFGKVGNVLKKMATSPVGKAFLDGLSEANEEWVQANLEPVLRNIIFDENNEIKPFSEDKLYAALLGFASAGVMNLPGTVTDIATSRQEKAIKKLQGQSGTEQSTSDIARDLLNGIGVSEGTSLNQYVQSIYDVAQQNPGESVDNGANNDYTNNIRSELNGTDQYAGAQIEAGRDAGISGQIVAETNQDLEKAIPALERRTDYRGIGSTVTQSLQEQGISPVSLSYTDNAENFYQAIGRAKQNNSHGAFVTQHEISDYANDALFLSQDGNVGVAVTPDGDIVSVFKNPQHKGKKAVSSILLTALDNGGMKLDNFNGSLSGMYWDHGFIPVARATFDEEFAPSDWNYDRDGKPDIIFWYHNGENAETVANKIGDYGDLPDLSQLPVMSYDEAAEYRDSLIAQNNTSIFNGAVNNAGNRPIRVTESELKLMSAIAKKGKLPFEIRDLGVDKQGKPIEGKYENGKIYVSPYAEKPSLVIFKHELTHHLENDAYRYKELLEVVKEFYAKNGQKLGTDFAAEIRKKQDLYRAKGQNINGDEAVREVVADFVGEHLFTDEKAIQYLADRKPHLGYKIVNWIREQIAAFKGDAETELLLKAERIYVKALKKAGKQTAVEGKTKYSYAGENAKTANLSALQKAIENDSIGKATKRTGGMDGLRAKMASGALKLTIRICNLNVTAL